MTGSDIFSDDGKYDPNHQTRIHYHQDQLSQISFSGEENATTPMNGKDDPNHQTRIHYHQDQVLVSSSIVLFSRIQLMVMVF